RGMLGPSNAPNLFKRLDGLDHPHYSQVLAAKRFGRALSASLDYSTQAGADTLRTAVSWRFGPGSPVGTVKYEEYRRVTDHPAYGFAMWADRVVAGGRLRLQSGYATIDRSYGGLNADRIQTGRRVFLASTVTITKALSVALYGTRALAEPYAITI